MQTGNNLHSIFLASSFVQAANHKTCVCCTIFLNPIQFSWIFLSLTTASHFFLSSLQLLFPLYQRTLDQFSDNISHLLAYTLVRLSVSALSLWYLSRFVVRTSS